MLKSLWDRFSVVEKLGAGAGVLAIVFSLSSENVRNSKFDENTFGLNRCNIFACN